VKQAQNCDFQNRAFQWLLSLALLYHSRQTTMVVWLYDDPCMPP